MTKTSRDSRKLSNAFVDRRAQLRLLVPCAAPLLLQIVFAFAVNYAFRAHFTSLADSADPRVLASVHELSLAISKMTAVWLAISGLITFVLWLRASHRLFGPTVAINRQLRALIEGNYQERLRLRKYDEFNEIAANLNELAETLAARG